MLSLLQPMNVQFLIKVGRPTIQQNLYLTPVLVVNSLHWACNLNARMSHSQAYPLDHSCYPLGTRYGDSPEYKFLENLDCILSLIDADAMFCITHMTCYLSHLCDAQSLASSFPSLNKSLLVYPTTPYKTLNLYSTHFYIMIRTLSDYQIIRKSPA